jgi:ankyrin repeat protein
MAASALPADEALAIVTALVEQDRVPATVTDGNGRTALHYAATAAVAKLLLTSTAIEVDLQDHTGRSALHAAALAALPGVVKAIVDSGRADINLPDDERRTALMMTMLKAASTVVNNVVDLESLAILLAAPGSDVNAVSQRSGRAIDQAGIACNADAAKMLIKVPGIDLKSDAEVYIPSVGLSYATPAKVAEANSCYHVADMIQAAGGA